MQLIDGTSWFKPLRKHLGKKTCELSEEDIQRICECFMEFSPSEHSKILDNEAFGYWKVTVEQPLRAVDIDPERAHSAKEIKALREDGKVSPQGEPVIRKITREGCKT